MKEWKERNDEIEVKNVSTSLFHFSGEIIVKIMLISRKGVRKVKSLLGNE
jgi:hypothetical protein